MVDQSSKPFATPDPLPLHELISRILAPETGIQRSTGWSGLGTMQSLIQRLVHQPLLDFFNYSLRGIGQVIFVNNPFSGLLILAALFIQSPWIGVMSIAGVMASTLTAITLKLDRDSLRNGIFGFNGILVGAALATVGASGNGNWNLFWMIAAILFSALTTLLLKTMGIWFASKFKFPPLTLPFIIATLLFLAIATWIPQPLFNLGSAPTSFITTNSIDWLRVAAALPIGFGQVFLMDKWIAGVLVLLAVALCTPIGAAVGLLGSLLGVVAGLLLGASPDSIYAGLWSYNAVLTAMAIAGVFYAPNLRSISVGSLCAFLSAVLGGLLAVGFALIKLPILTLPFCIATIACFLVLQRSLPSLVPVALHAISSPEEHRQRYLIAKAVITKFRQQLRAAISGKRYNFMFEQASPAIKGDLRYIFDAIDRDRSGHLSTQELMTHLHQSGKGISEGELAYLFKCMDYDGSGAIDFEEFGELMLRHRQLMSRYSEFLTYFLPIDTDEDTTISISEMNTVMASVGEPPLSKNEIEFLQYQTGVCALTWNQFIEVLLVT